LKLLVSASSCTTAWLSTTQATPTCCCCRVTAMCDGGEVINRFDCHVLLLCGTTRYRAARQSDPSRSPTLLRNHRGCCCCCCYSCYSCGYVVLGAVHFHHTTHLTSSSANDCTGTGVSTTPGHLSPRPSCPLLLLPHVYSWPSQLRPAEWLSLIAMAAQRPTACTQQHSKTPEELLAPAHSCMSRHGE
jgi:hypothetical protein